MAARKLKGLTDRELEILQLKVRGLTNAEAASVMKVSTGRASELVRSVKRKLEGLIPSERQ